MNRLPHFGPILAAIGISSLVISPSTAALIDALINVQQIENHPGGVTGSDGAAANTSNGSHISDSAIFGGGVAGFDIFPQAGTSGVSGVSNTVSYANWGAFLNESLSGAALSLSDQLHITGPISGQISGNIRFQWQGVLSPNSLFEQQYFDAHGGLATLTTSARAQATVANPQIADDDVHGLMGYVGSYLGSGNPCNPPCAIGTSVDGGFVLPFVATDAARNISLVFSLQADGRRGGGFDFGRVFDISVELPAGLGFTADGGDFIRSFVPGDANGDGCVSGADFTIWGDHFGQSPANLADGDFNEDGSVTGADFTIWGDHFGQGCTPSSNVPEPATMVLGALALFMSMVAREFVPTKGTGQQED